MEKVSSSYSVYKFGFYRLSEITFVLNISLPIDEIKAFHLEFSVRDVTGTEMHSENNGGTVHINMG